ncbi:Acidic leucine-rich nuclear phosphoprotein 32 family member A, partial [Fragariocoptes setiger]
MEKRIELEKRGKSPKEITELNLDNSRSPQISGLTEEFVNLENLSMINVGLVTLKGFPKLPKLKKLELSDNRIASGLNLLHGSPELQHLNLSGNRIKDFESLEPLKEFQNLHSLDLFNCEVTQLENYRENVFKLIPNLHSLDGYDRNEKEVEEEESDENSEDSSEEENHIKRDDGQADSDDSEEGDDDDDGGDVDDDYDEDDDDDDVYDDGDVDDEGDEEDDEDANPDLKYLEKDNIDESDGSDFAPEDDDDDDDIDIDPEDEDEDVELDTEKRGQKRKHEDEEEAEEAGDS